MKKAQKNKNVYVVELDRSVLSGLCRASRKFIAANPLHDITMPCLYVGRTGLTPEERFSKHINGTQNGYGYVTKFGINLVPELYEHLNPMTHDDVEKMEVKLAAKLRKAGYAVWQN